MKTPTTDEISQLRKDIQKRKTPPFNTDTEGAWKGIGNFAFSESENGVLVSWQVEGKEKKCANFNELCLDTGKEADRLELGWLIAAVINNYANDLLKQIPDPNEAQSYVEPELEMVKEWQHWAVVPAGHMVISEK